jgi:hypothetical protein
MKKYRQTKIKRQREHEKIVKLAKRQYVTDYLLAHPCVDCGEKDIIVLEFDHVRGDKKYNVSNLIMQSYGLNTLITEIEKCEVRCANCHRRITHKRRLTNDISKK